MKAQPKFPEQPVPDGYFKDLENQILSKTIDIETWEIPGTKNIESCFRVPEGFWLQQEEQIRQRIHKPGFSFPEFIPRSVLTPVLAGLVLILGFGLFYFLPESRQENWQAKMEILNQEEMIAYLSSDQEGLAQTEQELARVLESKDLPETELKINEKELEKELDQLDESELPHLTEIGYED